MLCETAGAENEKFDFALGAKGVMSYSSIETYRTALKMLLASEFFEFYR